jgi:hypothetical protein
MITNPEAARQVSALMLHVGAQLNQSVAVVQNLCDRTEFERYRSAVGDVMGVMLLDIMNPLYAMHPELKPPELK